MATNSKPAASPARRARKSVQLGSSNGFVNSPSFPLRQAVPQASFVRLDNAGAVVIIKLQRTLARSA
jgi:hypothetical protein